MRGPPNNQAEGDEAEGDEAEGDEAEGFLLVVPETLAMG